MEFFHDFCVMKKMIESWQLLSVDVKTGNFSLLLYFCVVQKSEPIDLLVWKKKLRNNLLVWRSGDLRCGESFVDL